MRFFLRVFLRLVVFRLVGRRRFVVGFFFCVMATAVSPTSAAAPRPPAMIAPVLRPFFSSGGVMISPFGGGSGGGAGGAGGRAGGGAAALGTQLLTPGGAHHAGLGLHPGGAFGRRLRAAVAVPEPYLPSAVTPSTLCAAQTASAFASRHGLSVSNA